MTIAADTATAHRESGAVQSATHGIVEAITQPGPTGRGDRRDIARNTRNWATYPATQIPTAHPLCAVSPATGEQPRGDQRGHDDQHQPQRRERRDRSRHHRATVYRARARSALRPRSQLVYATLLGGQHGQRSASGVDAHAHAGDQPGDGVADTGKDGNS